MRATKLSVLHQGKAVVPVTVLTPVHKKPLTK